MNARRCCLKLDGARTLRTLPWMRRFKAALPSIRISQSIQSRICRQTQSRAVVGSSSSTPSPDQWMAPLTLLTYASQSTPAASPAPIHSKASRRSWRLTRVLISRCLTFDMSGGLADAKRLARRPLDGRVRPRFRCLQLLLEMSFDPGHLRSAA